ncbi:MAG: 1-acyl-sn-glycerol-3-phosphate acyltransferase [Gaiellales bacterium]
MSTTADDTTARTGTCKGVTQGGVRCKRKAKPGNGGYCAIHVGQAARTESDTIDRDELDDVISDFDSGPFDGNDGFGGDDMASSVIDELRQIADYVGENVDRIRDAAVDAGIVDDGLLERVIGDCASAIAHLAQAFAARATGDYEEDDFGFDEQFTERIVPLATLLYRYYWRVDIEGIENVPGTGRGVLVSNHAGAGIPFDGAMIKTAIMLEHPTPRHVRLLVLDWVMSLPWLADLMKQTGQVLASSPNAYELLKRDQLIAVFPEGVKGMSKPFSQRYNLARFGRGGFVRIALRTGSPIIPVAVVGSEEIYPKIANLPFVNKLIGAPFVPVTPMFPLLGLAGLIPLPSKWNIEFCDPIDVSQFPKEAADDRAFVLELSERVRATIQERLRENLLKRRTPFW